MDRLDSVTHPVAASDAGRVGVDPGLFAFQDYRQAVFEQTAFAIHDELWSAYLYGELAGGDVPRVMVAYPDAGRRTRVVGAAPRRVTAERELGRSSPADSTRERVW